MRIHTIVRSPGAIALGIVCAIGTAIVLFWHVRSLADITSNHVMIALALVVTLGAGHFMWSAAHFTITGIISFLAFGALFMAGTAVCVSLSGGRTAEVIQAKNNDASHESARRTAQEARVLEIKADRDKAGSDLDKAKAAAVEADQKAAEECGTGKRSKCDGRTLTSDTAQARVAEAQKHVEQLESHYWVEMARLSDIKPRIANADLKQIAKVIAFVRGIPEDKALEGVELLWPYMLALITEFGTIAFLNYGFGHKRVAELKVPQLPEPKKTVSELATEAAEVIAALKKAKRPVTNDELAMLMGVTKGEASKRVTALNGIVRRVRTGREVAISINEH